MVKSTKGPPNLQIDTIPAGKSQEITKSLIELHELGKPVNNDELRQRIENYFNFCGRSCIRPGVESLCYCLSISRTTMFRWSHGEDCDQEREEIINTARQMISAYLERVTGRKFKRFETN